MDDFQTGSIGHVISIAGSQAVLSLDGAAAPSERISIGKLVVINSGQSRVVAVISHVAVPATHGEVSLNHARRAEADLVGEIRWINGSDALFQRGITHYPVIGDPVVAITEDDLNTIHKIQTANTIDVGHLQQNRDLPARINVDELLCKHFAILGSTGVGKSCSVALVLQEILAADPEMRIFIFDPHNEYAPCFGDNAEIVDPNNIVLPFWLFSFEEIVDVFFGGRPGVDEEVEILSEAISMARSMYDSNQPARGGGVRRKVNARQAALYSVDKPVPYRISDLVMIITDQMGKLENRAAIAKYSRLLSRINTVTNDPRYRFMFGELMVTDNMAEVLSYLFRIPTRGKQVSIMQLAGFPVEVVDSVVSVLTRMAFDLGLWSDGAFRLLVVCEEAHRYLPADKRAGFGPTRRAFSRIAKEGRKYGIYLGIVTQRPGELDATILSQCSSLFVMRMANDQDQAIVKAAVSDAGSSLLKFLPSLGTGEAVAFGEAVPLPTRLQFKQIPERYRPRSESVRHSRFEAPESFDSSFVKTVVERWRGSTSDDPEDEMYAADDANSQVAKVTLGTGESPAVSLEAPVVGKIIQARPTVVPTDAPKGAADNAPIPMTKRTFGPKRAEAVEQRPQEQSGESPDWAAIRDRMRQGG